MPYQVSTVNNVLLFIAAIASILVLIFFVLVLLSIKKLVDKMNGLVDENKKQLDNIMEQAPVLMNNVNMISTKTSMLVDDLNEVVIKNKDDVTGIIRSANKSMDDIQRITETATDIAYRAESAAKDVEETVYSITGNVNDVHGIVRDSQSHALDYANIFLDFFQEMGRIVFKGRR